MTMPITSDFDPIFAQFAATTLSFSEAEALNDPFWKLGESARLREDARFRQTPWGRWMRADRWLANERFLLLFSDSELTEIPMEEALEAIPARLPLVFCTADPRFRLEGGILSLSATGRKALPRPKRRNISDQGLEKRATSLRSRLLATAPPPPPSAEKEPEEEELPGCALALDNDGLRIVVPPIGPERLPGFVKRLRLMVAPTPLDFPLVRLRPGYEAALPPMSESYRWTGYLADGNEVDDVDLQALLAGLETPGFPAGVVAAFCAGPDGRHWRQAGRRLVIGRQYRLLFPPDVPVPSGVETSPAALWQDAWRVWNVDLGTDPGIELKATLEGLGFVFVSRSFWLEWCGDPPSAWRVLAGQSAPVFDRRDRIVLRLCGQPGEAALLLVGEAGQVHLPIGAAEGQVGCAELAAGAYVLEGVPRDVAIPRVRVWFFVEENAGVSPAARVGLHWQDSPFEQAPEEDFRAIGNLDEVQIVAPPCWPVQMLWQGIEGERRFFAHADRDGLLTGVLALVGDAVARDVRARLDVRFAELGHRLFEHVHLPDDQEFLRILEKRLPMATAGLPTDIRVLQKMWLEPILHPLGWRLGVAEPDISTGAVCWSLSTMVEEGERLLPKPTTRLILLPEGVDPGGEEAKKLPNLLAGPLRRVLVTDGLCWRRFVRRQPPGPAFDLRAVPGNNLLLHFARIALTPELG